MKRLLLISSLLLALAVPALAGNMENPGINGNMENPGFVLFILDLLF